jgi:hypothetical protein
VRVRRVCHVLVGPFGEHHGTAAAAAAAPAAAAANAHSQQPWQAGIDLGLLTNALSAPEALEEPDEVWAFSRLLNALDQQLTRDKEEAAAADAKSGAAVGAGAKL